ncbi:hypothetical protein [Empedobacter brevis]
MKIKKNTLSKVDLGVDNNKLNKGLEATSYGIMLSFPSIEAYQAKLLELEMLVESHEEAFVSQYPNLSDEELDSVAELLNHDTYKPLKDFEASMNFTNSLRSDVAAKEAVWLNTSTELDLNANPSKSIYFDTYEQSLLNKHQEVMIGGVVYIFRDTNLDYEVTSDFQSNLTDISNNVDVSGRTSVSLVEKISQADLTNNCGTNKEQNYSNVYRSDRKVDERLYFNGSKQHARAITEIAHYKKKGSKWKKSYADIGLKFSAKFYSTNCQVDKSTYKDNHWNKRRRKDRISRTDIWLVNRQYAVKKNEGLIATYQSPAGVHERKLNW